MEQVMKNQRVALITFDEQEKVFHLSNSEISYILQIEESEVLLMFILVKERPIIIIIKNILAEIVAFLGTSP